MENAGYIALSRQLTLQRSIDITANNIANSTTSGFKAHGLLFEEYLQKNPSKENSFEMVNDYGLFMDTSEGSFKHTDNPLDLAIQGPGFFQVETEEGLRYTRTGEFQLNAAGEIVTGAGHILTSTTNAPIVVPPGTTEIEITKDGNVVAFSPVADVANIGQIGMFEFTNAQNLQQIGNNLYTAVNEEPLRSRDSAILQGTVEQSNVEPVTEITKLIQLSRDYQAAQKMISDEHDRIRNAISTLSGRNS